MNELTQVGIAALVKIENGKPVTSSLKVAEVFGKDHKNVLRDIASLECSAGFRELNFEPSSYKVETGNGTMREYPCYNMTRDGFTFLAMGFTGKEAAAFKERYIAEFNHMAETLNGCIKDIHSRVDEIAAAVQMDHAFLQGQQALNENQQAINVGTTAVFSELLEIMRRNAETPKPPAGLEFLFGGQPFDWLKKQPTMQQSAAPKFQAAPDARLVGVIMDTIRNGLKGVDIDPTQSCFIRSRAISFWFARIDLGGEPNRVIRQLVNRDILPQINKHRPIWPNKGKDRRRGFFWGMGSGKGVPVVDMADGRNAGIVVLTERTFPRVSQPCFKF